METDWDAITRQSAVVMKGFQIEAMSKTRIVSMYPELEQSKWWIDQTEDTYLSVFFGNPDPLGVHVGGKYYGVSAWRPALRRMFKLNCVYEMLYRFSTPMNGQQKNLLVAMTTMAQTRVLDYELYPGYLEGRESARRVLPETSPGADLDAEREDAQLRSLAIQELPRQQGGRQLMEQLARTSGTAAMLLTPEGQGLGLAITHNSDCGEECTCDRRYVIPGAIPPVQWDPSPMSDKQKAIEFVSYINSTYVWKEGNLIQRVSTDPPKPSKNKVQQRRQKKIDKLLESPTIERIRPYVDVIGSRMGLDSGLWHDSFSSFVASFHPTVNLRYFDAHEEPRRYTIGQTQIEHIRGWYTGPKHTVVQIDDAQTGDDHVAPVWPRVFFFSEKKRGEESFGIRENRFFSHLRPALIKESMVSCHCLRCKTTSYIAQVYGGWPVYERIREYLAKLGPVCDHSNMLGMTTQIFEITQSHMRTGEPIPPEYKSIIPITEENGPIQKFVRSRNGAVYAYLSDFKNKKFLRAHPIDFLVADSLLPLQEVGTPEYILSQASINFPGYRPDRVLEGYTVWKIDREMIKPSFELKW